MRSASVSLGASAERTKASIIDACHSGLDSLTLGAEVLRKLAKVVPFDEPCWLTTDPSTSLITGAIWDNLPGWAVQTLPELELDETVNNLWVLARSNRQVGVLSEQTEGRLEESLRYREVFSLLGFGDHIRAALVIGNACWGSLTLQREQSSRLFTPEEAAFVEQISVHLADAMRTALLLGSVGAARGSIEGPGLLVLNRDFSVLSMTPIAQLWLDEIREGKRQRSEGELPPVIYAVASMLRVPGREGEGIALSMPRARLRTKSGRWLMVHASRLVGENTGEQTAIILEAARPEELAPIIVAAYGLTDREKEIAQLALRGLSTAEIAELLVITVNTVQDHLKAIFDKVGVRSRRELVAQIFAQHYQPRIAEGSQLGPSGWFAEV